MYSAITSSVTFPLLQQKPTRPQMLPPEAFLQVRKLRQQLVRRLPFHPRHQPADRHLRRDRYKQMHVIHRHMPFQNRHLVALANLADSLPRPQPHLPRQYAFPILGRPHQMQMDLEH